MRILSGLLIVFFVVLWCTPVLAEVCVSDAEAVDLITLLDASERDMNVLGKCELLVKDLYAQVEEKDQKVVTLTNDLINAKKQVLAYEKANRTWKTVSLVSVSTNIVFVILTLL